MIDEKNVGEKVLTTGVFPPASMPDDVAKSVYAVYEHARLARDAWDRSIDTNRRFFNGDQIKVRRNSPNIVDNQIDVAVGTVRPRILRSVRKIEVGAAAGGDPAATDLLSLRVEYGCKRSYLEDMVLPESVDDMLVDGAAILKADASVMVVNVEPKTIFWTPETGFDSAWYIGQCHLMTIGEAEAIFGRSVKGLKAETTDLVNRENEVSGPPATSDSAGDILTVSVAPVNESSPVRRYSDYSIGSNFTKSGRVFVIELWVLDRAKHGDEYVYHCGRLINVAVGASADGSADKSSVKTLLDRPNPFEKLHMNTGRWHPYSYAPYEGRKGIWSNSLVTKILPLQRGLNDAWNTWIKNAKLVNNPRMLAHKSLGLKAGSITNQPGEITEVPESYNFPANTALTFMSVPSIAQHFIPIRESFLNAIRDVSGIMDVTRGENPTGVTAGIALSVLDSNANERISSPAKSLSLALAQAKENMAYIAQELDDAPMVLPDDRVETDNKFENYDPEVVRDQSIRVTSVERLPLDQVIAILNAVADLEAKGLPGEMVLRYIDDPTLHQLYVQKKQERVLAEQMAMMEQEQMAEEGANTEFEREVVGKAVDAAIKGGQSAVQK